MERKEIIDYCKTCINKRTSHSGLICGLSNEFPIIDTACQDLQIDKKLLKFQEEQEEIKFKRNKQITINMFSILAICSLAFVVLAHPIIDLIALLLLQLSFMALAFQGKLWARTALSIMLLLEIIGGLLSLLDLYADYSSKAVFVGMLSITFINIIWLGFIRNSEHFYQYLIVKAKRSQ